MAFDDPFQEHATRVVRARRHFTRRKKATLAGLHLPSELELLAGMPFLANDVRQDMQAFAERLAPRLRRKADDDLGIAAVVYHLEQLTVGAGLDEVQALTDAFAICIDALPPHARSWRLRCRIYRAHLGDHRAAMDLARDAVIMACKLEAFDLDGGGAALDLIRRSLGWLTFAASDPGFVYLGDGDPMRFRGKPVTTVSQSGELLVDLIERRALLAAPDDKAAADIKAPVPAANNTTSAPPGEEQTGPSALPVAVVFKQVGNASTGEGKKVAKELEDLLGKPLPLVPMPDLAAVRVALRSEFPYAADMIDRLLQDIPVRPHVQLRPTILVGTPGCGKSRFARRLLTALALPHDVIPCGGISDGAFAGTPRRWSTGEPSLPVALITRYRSAGPGAVLDEIEKVGTSRHNGQAHDALLAFLEPETACRFHDPYVQAPCNLSHVTWLMTANTLEGLSAPLKDRCQVVRFPEPGPEHLPALSRQIMIDLLAAQGLDHRWVSSLDAIEMEALAGAWPGGSLRKLKRLIEVTLSSRAIKH